MGGWVGGRRVPEHCSNSLIESRHGSEVTLVCYEVIENCREWVGGWVGGWVGERGKAFCFWMHGWVGGWVGGWTYRRVFPSAYRVYRAWQGCIHVLSFGSTSVCCLGWVLGRGKWVGGWVGGWVGEWKQVEFLSSMERMSSCSFFRIHIGFGGVGGWVGGWVGGGEGDGTSGWVGGWVGGKGVPGGCFALGDHLIGRFCILGPGMWVGGWVGGRVSH